MSRCSSRRFSAANTDDPGAPPLYRFETKQSRTACISTESRHASVLRRLDEFAVDGAGGGKLCSLRGTKGGIDELRLEAILPFGPGPREPQAILALAVLPCTVISIVLVLFDLALATYDAKDGVGLFSSIFSLVVIVPAFLVYIKRWHDRDKSGWWMLIVLIPLVGLIWFLVELGFLPGTPGPNRFGPPPLD